MDGSNVINIGSEKCKERECKITKKCKCQNKINNDNIENSLEFINTEKKI